MLTKFFVSTGLGAFFLLLVSAGCVAPGSSDNSTAGQGGGSEREIQLVPSRSSYPAAFEWAFKGRLYEITQVSFNGTVVVCVKTTAGETALLSPGMSQFGKASAECLLTRLSELMGSCFSVWYGEAFRLDLSSVVLFGVGITDSDGGIEFKETDPSNPDAEPTKR